LVSGLKYRKDVPSGHGFGSGFYRDAGFEYRNDFSLGPRVVVVRIPRVKLEDRVISGFRA